MPGPVRVALRLYYESRWQVLALAVPAYFVTTYVSLNLSRLLLKIAAPEWVLGSLNQASGEPMTGALSELIFLAYFLISFCLGFFLGRRLVLFVARMFALDGVLYRRVDRWADMVSSCAAIARASNRKVEWKGVPLGVAVSEIRAAMLTRGVGGVSLSGRAQLRSHANQVIATIRAAHAELNCDRTLAARKLAGMALLMSDRYSRGAVGALLDRDQLVASGWRREDVRVAVVAAACTLMGLAVQAMGMPVPLAVGIVVFSGVWLYRGAASAGLAVLATLLPLFLSGG